MGNNGFYNYLRANFIPDVTFEQACDFKAKFFAGYPDMAKWQDEFARASREQGYTQTIAGRRWHWKWHAQDADDLDEDTPFYADKLIGFRGAYAVNHPVQGSSAELIATVHDEAVLLVPDDMAAVERIGAIAQREMIAALLEVFPDAPTLHLVDPAVGPTWGDLKPLQTWLDERISLPERSAA